MTMAINATMIISGNGTKRSRYTITTALLASV
jgi:hypothetical protein